MTLYSKIHDFQNLHTAYFNARKGKRYRTEILEFSQHLEENLLALQSELKDKTYRHGPYKHFIVHDAKKRRIQAAPFRDRVVHHAVCAAIEPIFEKGFIYDSYACRNNKGTHKALKRLEKFLCFYDGRRRNKETNRTNREKRTKKASTNSTAVELVDAGIISYANGGGALEDIYYLKCDISKYFHSIDHETLLALLRKKITDPGLRSYGVVDPEETLWLLEEIIRSTHTAPHKGIPIGNLTSQYFANIYLNELDQFVKHTLRAPHYIRYMDDFLILDADKNKLHDFKKEIQGFLWASLQLEVHPKKAQVAKVADGIEFLGYRVYGTHRHLRKSTVKRFVKRTRKYQEKVKRGEMEEECLKQSLQSWNAYAKHGNSWRLRRDLEKRLGIELPR